MEETKKTEDTFKNNDAAKVNFTKLLLFIAPYSLTVSVLYLWGYWSTFGINILEFYALSDIVKSCVYPIVTSLCVIIAWSILFGLGVGLLGKLQTETPLLRKAMYWIDTIFLGVLSLLVIKLVAKIDFPNDMMFSTGLFLLFVVLWSVIEKLIPNFEIELSKRLNISAPSMFIFLLLAFLAFGFGKDRANLIVKNKIYKTVNRTAIDKAANIDKNDKLKYLGTVSDKVFLLGDDNKTVYIVKFGDIDVLKLEQGVRVEKKD